MDRTHNQSVLQSHFVPLRLDWTDVFLLHQNIWMENKLIYEWLVYEKQWEHLQVPIQSRLYNIRTRTTHDQHYSLNPILKFLYLYIHISFLVSRCFPNKGRRIFSISTLRSQSTINFPRFWNLNLILTLNNKKKIRKKNSI